MRRRIIVQLIVDSDEPVSDQELADEVVDLLNMTGDSCEYPLKVELAKATSLGWWPYNDHS